MIGVDVSQLRLFSRLLTSLLDRMTRRRYSCHLIPFTVPSSLSFTPTTTSSRRPSYTVGKPWHLSSYRFSILPSSWAALGYLVTSTANEQPVRLAGNSPVVNTTNTQSLHNLDRKVESFFPTHHERNTYVTLLQKTNPPTADALLKAALIRRAIEDVRRAVRIREDKPALQNLIQKGAVGDDLWNSMLAAEKELEAEVLEVMHEANSFAPGWGQIIFTSAGEMVQNEKMTKQYMDIPKLRAEMGTFYSMKSL